jgi:thiamine biosynthesis lipoprotein
MPAPVALDPAFQAVLTEFDRLDALLSEWRPDTPISKLNAAQTAPVPMPAEAMGLLQTALDLAQVTQGGFDPTFATLSDLWRFKPGAPRPSQAHLSQRLPAVGHRHLILDPRTQTARLDHPQTRIGLGAIAKGYAVARANQILRAHQLKNYCLKVGGELYCAGEKAPGTPWIVGVQHPRDPSALVAQLPIRDAAFTTSGDYERFVMRGATRDHHILDPRTGHPARGLQSVTILARNPIEADALSTGIFVLGLQAGLALIETMPGAEAVLIDAHGILHKSSGLTHALLPSNAPKGPL